VGPDGLKVVELLGIDVGESLPTPTLRQEAGCERRALRTVVPAPERGDEDGPAQRRPALDAEMP
jgi:hypothetical protein